MNEEQKSAPPGDFSATTTFEPCWSMMPNHKHCVHGHTKDCTNPDNCELMD